MKGRSAAARAFAQKKKGLLQRAVACLLGLFFLVIPLCAPATEEGFVEPTLGPNALPYDELSPEILEPDMLYAQSAILVETSTGNVVFEKNADQIMYPASTTKILTALIALQFGDLSDTVTVSPWALYLEEGAVALPLSEGERINLRDLIYGTMLKSANDGANAIAEHIAGSNENFAALMNEVAQVLGCENTHFTNPHGLHDPNHYTTARDMSLIALEAMDYPLFREISATSEYLLPSTNVHPAVRLQTTNRLLRREENNRYYSPDAIGIKTGYTSAAGYCFVGAARKGGVELISVVYYTSAAGQWTDTQKLLDYGFSQYQGIDPIDVYRENPRAVNITGFALTDENLGQLELDIRAIDEERHVYMIGTNDEIESLKRDFSKVSHVNWTHDFRAPIEQGTVMGILTFYPQDGSEYVEYELFATRSVAAREDAPLTIEEIERYTQEDPNPFPRFSLEFVLPPLIVLLLLILLIIRLRRGRRRNKRQEKRIPKPKNRTFR